VDTHTGGLATGGCPSQQVAREWFLSGSVPNDCPEHGGRPGRLPRAHLREVVPLKRSPALAAADGGGLRARPRTGGGEPIAEGLASYYGEALRGHRTASGEPFNPDAFTRTRTERPFSAFSTRMQVPNARTGARRERVGLNGSPLAVR